MSPVPLPTDNLYKFCAFAGLLFIAVSLYAIRTGSDSIQRKLIWLERDEAIHNAERDAIQPGDQNGALAAALEKLKPPGEKASIEEKQAYVEQAEAQAAEVQARISSVQEEGQKWREAFYRSANMIATQKEIILSAKQLQTIRWVGAGFIAIGSALAYYGFFNWRRIQLLQDEQLRQQVKGN